jgi:predicted transcriptional regulator of viral defense system
MDASKRRQRLARVVTTNSGAPASGPLLTAAKLRQVGAGSFFRTRDAAELGLRSADLRRLVDEDAVERVARGLYRLADAEPTEHYTVAAVCARVPDAIVCLLSALSVHGLGTQLPREVWIAIPHKARAPRISEFPIKVVRFSGAALRYGVENIRLEGVPARVTNPARTVVDCFRFRRLVGRDVAREALRDALRERKASVDEIWRAAEVCRARSLVGPYLEVLTG